MNFETTQQSREYYAKKYPQLSEVILNKDNCFSVIFQKAKELGFGIEQIEDSKTALSWAIEFPEDKDQMIHLITESNHAYWWAYNFPQDKDKMIHLITKSNHAYSWAKKFPQDKDQMIHLITESNHAYWWAHKFPQDRPYFQQKFPNLF